MSNEPPPLILERATIAQRREAAIAFAHELRLPDPTDPHGACRLTVGAHPEFVRRRCMMEFDHWVLHRLVHATRLCRDEGFPPPSLETPGERQDRCGNTYRAVYDLIAGEWFWDHGDRHLWDDDRQRMRQIETVQARCLAEACRPKDEGKP